MAIIVAPVKELMYYCLSPKCTAESSVKTLKIYQIKKLEARRFSNEQ